MYDPGMMRLSADVVSCGSGREFLVFSVVGRDPACERPTYRWV